MKKVINSAIAAFAMFSRIPMPRCDWEKDNIRYMLVFMPLVGAVIGAVSYVWAFIGGRFWYDRILESMLLFLIPFVLTGGIHLDGFLDTTDALSSWKSKRRTSRNLKRCTYRCLCGDPWCCMADVYVCRLYICFQKRGSLAFPGSCFCDEPDVKCTVNPDISESKRNGNGQYMAEGCGSKM